MREPPSFSDGFHVNVNVVSVMPEISIGPRGAEGFSKILLKQFELSNEWMIQSQ